MMTSFYWALFRLLRRRWVWYLILLVLVAGAFWFLAPLVTIGGVHPLAVPWMRIGLPVAVVLLVLLLLNLGNLRLRWEKYRLARRGFGVDEPLSLENSGIEDRLAVMERFEAAIDALGASTQTGTAGADYGMPWYLMLGAGDSGRSTLLGQAELDLALNQPAVGGEGEPCDIWIGRQAVVVDAAGHVALQEESAGRGDAAWRTTLQMLSHYRPRRPLNGVVLVLPIDLVLDTDDGRRRHRAEAFRRRLQEASSQFGMRLPVYVVVSKCDLLAGFSEFFDTTAIDEREQAWGFSLPLQRGEVSDSLVRRVADEVALLDERVQARVAPRLHQERDPVRRRLVCNFALQFSLFRRELAGFLGEFLRGNRNEPAPALRGVYLTSATRTAFNPHALFGLVAPPFELEAGLVPAPMHPDRSFFVGHLFSQSILPELNLVGSNRKVELGLLWRHAVLYACAGLVALVVAGFWWIAYDQGRGRLTTLQNRVGVVAASLRQASGNADLASVFPALSTFDAAARAYRTSPGLPAFLDLGLTPDPAVDARLDEVGRALLRDAFQPRAAALARTQLVQQMGPALSGGSVDTRTVRQALRTYLMLCMPEHADPGQLNAWAVQQAHAKFALFPEQGAALQSGMARLVEAGLEPLAIDAAPVNQARRILLQQTPAEELYANLKRIALNSAIPDFRLSNLGGAGGGFGGDVVTSPASVPGLFTADGFYNVFLRYLPTLTTSSAEDDWMFDAGSILAASASQDKLIQQVSDLYVADYVQQWRTLISSIRLYDFHSIDDAGQTLDRLAGPDSPLRAVLVALRNNVALPPPGAPSSATSAAAPATAPGGLAERAFGGLSRLVSNASASPSPATASPGAASAAPGAAQDGVAGDPTVPPPIAGPNWPGTRIAQAFQPLTSLVDGGDTRQQGIDTVLNAIANLSATVKSIASASNPPQAAYQFAAGRVSGHPGQQGDALTAVRRFGDRQPDPVRMWLYTLSGYSWEAIMGFARGAVEDAWEHQVVPEWRRSMLDRYPIFADSKTETSLKDFGTFFGPDGVLDKFFQNWLSPFVNTNGITWESARIDGQSLDIAPDALDQLQQAALIRQAFFPESGSNMPKVHFTLEPTLLGARSIQIQLAIEDSTLIYRHDPPRAWKLTWPGDTSPGTMRITLTDVQNRNWSMEKDGVWALFRLLDSTHLHGTASDDRFLLNLTLGDVPASFELRADSANGNPFDLSLLHDFRLPDHVM